MDDDGALIVLYDGGCGFCTGAARWLRRRDRARRLRLVAIPDHFAARGRVLERATLEEEMHVIDARGRVETGYRAWRRVAAELPMLRPLLPLLWMPGMETSGGWVYRWVAAHRSLLGRLLHTSPGGAQPS